MHKILLIEPDAFFAEILNAVFRREGWLVLHAQTGEQGLRDAAAEQPDAILLAIKLAKMDGFETLEELKKDERTWSIPVIMLTDLGSKEDVDHCYGKGCDGYLIKTHHVPADIVAHVRGLLK